MHRVGLKIAGTEIALETGKIATLATAAVVARSGDNVLLATVVASETPRPDSDFFPLTVEYREKFAATGRIPGSVMRREGRITDHEILVSRLLDRSVRSLFPAGFRREVQIQVAVLSANPESDLQSLAIIAATAALHVSPLPVAGPAAGLRIVRCAATWLPFPSLRQRAEADLDFVVSAGPDGLVMVEGEADQAPRADCIAALEKASEWIARIARSIEELRAAAGTEKEAPPTAAALPELPSAVRDALRAALAETGKAARRHAVAAAKAAHLDSIADEERAAHSAALEAAHHELVREAILADGHRLDGRGPADIRAIQGEVGWLPRAHGSAIFTRGETQALVTCTLGPDEDALPIYGLSGMQQERFLLHYNFPPYSVNEVRPLRGPGRREIGHGALARRGLLRAIPDFAAFPYTIRCESDIAQSNGSSSMATVCGATLAMLNAGVPLRMPVAGIAMGLVTDGARTAVLSDILGDEDHLGDMDFKVVGTERGVTALQLDNKVGGLTSEQLAAALAQADDGVRTILAKMREVIDGPGEMSRHAPRVEKTAIMPDAVGLLVGPRGANIKAIQAATGARVSIDEDAIVRVYAADARAARAAMVKVWQSAGVVRAGRCYRGSVTGVKDFGVFVRINQLTEGLVPAEELGEQRTRPDDVAAIGDEMVVRVLGADSQGRLRLSRKEAIGVDETQIEY
jgi:polyribonucleotide nucleotidyltransferase